MIDSRGRESGRILAKRMSNQRTEPRIPQNCTAQHRESDGDDKDVWKCTLTPYIEYRSKLEEVALCQTVLCHCTTLQLHHAISHCLARAIHIEAGALWVLLGVFK